MSSHHFVIEGQEPALLIETKKPLMHPFFDQLAGWNPIIIATEEAIPELILANVNVDHLLTRNSEDESGKNFRTELPHLQIHSIGDGRVGDAIAGILKKADCKHVQLITDDCDDFDQWNELARDAGLTVFTPSHIWKHITSGTFRAWYPKGQRLEFYGKIQMGRQAGISKYQSDVDGIIEISATEQFWVGELLN